MRQLILVVMLLPLLTFGNAIWGKTGHRVTGYLAEKHLTRKARKAISELLEGHSLAFVSTYADEIKSDRKYDAYYPWHYVNYPLDATYEASDKSELGDLITGISNCKAVLMDANSSREAKVFHLKMLIHFLGDLHQPMHAGRAADRGGNDVKVQWFSEDSNLHKVWDTNMLESYGMSFYELGDELDRSTTRKERKQLQQGEAVAWLEESHALAEVIYGSATDGEQLRYGYCYKYNPILFESLRKGGFRLAKVLNDIFS